MTKTIETSEYENGESGSTWLNSGVTAAPRSGDLETVRKVTVVNLRARERTDAIRAFNGVTSRESGTNNKR